MLIEVCFRRLNWGNVILWVVILGKKIGVKIESEWINVEMDLFYMKICLKMV